MRNKFYITAAIPYVNAKPHIGHALEFVQTDLIARHHRLLGDETLALSGGDENALKNVQAAEKAGEEIQSFIDKNTNLFYELTCNLNVQFDIWQKGSDKEKHFVACQKLWQLCQKDIYKKSYKGLYCVGCETFYAAEELDSQGECFEHPGKKLDEVEEVNYFFKLSNYQNHLTDLINTDSLEIVPPERKNEVLKFLEGGLTDISISRSNDRAKNWGVPVPGDPNQRMYVWFDALNIYQSGVGFGWNDDSYQKWWPADIHTIGKGIVRFHAVYWPAFLLSAGLPIPKKLFVHGYYTVNGQKMSKTIGNVYDPDPLVSKYGADALRYYLLAKTPPFTDGDFSEDKFVEAYNSDLANGLGNLVARIAKLASLCTQTFRLERIDWKDTRLEAVRLYIDQFRINEAAGAVWKWIHEADAKIARLQPWTLKGEEFETTMLELGKDLMLIAAGLQPFLPESAERILTQFSQPRIVPEEALFPRIQ